MKNRKFDQQHERYKELIMRMEQRKMKMDGSPKNSINIQDFQINRQNQMDNRYRQRTYDNDDVRVRSIDQKNEIPKLMPNSTKNYRYNDEHQKNNPPQQQYFRNSKDSQAAINSQRGLEGYHNASEGNLHSKGRLPKQFFYQRNLNTIDQTDSNKEYQKLHQKLDFIENKIVEMKNNLQKKRQQKRRGQQQQQRQKKNQQQKSEGNQKPNPLKNFVTQVSQHTDVHSFDKNPYSPRHNIYYVSQVIRAYKQEQSVVREHLHTSLQILRMLENAKIPTNQQMNERKIKLPRRKGYQNKKSVVFDLDETLIHCNESLDIPYDVKLPITFPTGEVIQAGINIRPNATQILQQLSKSFEVIVFTASHSCYASVVLDHLDPQGLYIHHRLFREHCHATPQGIYIKDLRVMDRELSNVVLVDNAAYSYAFQLDNGIPIIPYYHGSTDFELKTLQTYIEKLLFVNDVRDVNRKVFKLHEYHKYYQDPDRLVQQLYIEEQKTK